MLVTFGFILLADYARLGDVPAAWWGSAVSLVMLGGMLVYGSFKGTL